MGRKESQPTKPFFRPPRALRLTKTFFFSSSSSLSFFASSSADGLCAPSEPLSSGRLTGLLADLLLVWYEKDFRRPLQFCHILSSYRCLVIILSLQKCLFLMAEQLKESFLNYYTFLKKTFLKKKRHFLITN